MKKHIVILFLFSTTNLIFAGDFFVGTNLGLNLSQVSFVPTVSQNYLAGYNGGIVARYISEPHLGLQAELNFSQRGWAEKTEETGNIHRRLNYVELPVMTHIYFGSKTFRGFVNLGPKIGFFTGEEKPEIEEHTPDRFSMPVKYKFDYALAGGLGFGLAINRFFYQVEGRYGFGLGDFFSNNKADPYSRSAFRTVSVNFSVLYKL